MKKFEVEKEKAVIVRINYSSFHVDDKDRCSKWQELYFRILSWKNTWSLAYEVDMLSYYDDTPYVKIIAKRQIKEQLVDWLKSIEYDESAITATDTHVGILYDYDDGMDDIEKYYCE